MNLTELHASLNRQKGGFDRWAHSRLNAVESIRQNHEVEMKKANVEYEELKENKQKMALEVEKLDSSIQEENQEAQVLLDKLNNVKKSSKLLPEEVQRLREEISLKKDLFQQRESEMQHGVDAKQSKLNSLQELADLYGERLGLSFKQANGETEDNALCISFTQIDRRNPEKPFWFNVRIMDDDTYSIQKVVPEVNGMKELEEELNTDNNFSKFVRKMRRKFKESV